MICSGEREAGEERECVEVVKTREGVICLRFLGGHQSVSHYTDFLRVPAWCVEGLK